MKTVWNTSAGLIQEALTMRAEDPIVADFGASPRKDVLKKAVEKLNSR